MQTTEFSIWSERMTALAMPKLVTAEEFAMIPECDGARLELVNGEVKELPPSPMPIHGSTQMNAGLALSGFVRPRRLGAAFTETGFLISRNPDTVRMPDVAFVSVDKLPGDRLPDWYFPFAPDIAVEVETRLDTPSAARARAMMWLGAGSALVWMLFTESRSATVYRADGTITTLGEDDILDAAPVLDGFFVKISEFFDVFG